MVMHMATVGTAINYGLLIFDFDGTLVDTAPDIASHANRVLREYGFPEQNLAVVKKAIGHGVHDLLSKLASGLSEDVSKLDEMVSLFKKYYSTDPVIATAAYPYVLSMLNGPLKNIKKVIITNKPEDLTHRILKELCLDSFFEKVIGGGSDFPAKPDPSSVLHMIRQTRISPQRTLFIGDSRVDYQTCLAAGIDFVWMDYGYDDSLKDEPGIKSFSMAKSWASLVGD